VSGGRRVLRALLAGWWTVRAARAVKVQLARHALTPVFVPAVPTSLAGSGPRVVAAVLRWLRAPCLERATVLQAWHLAHGRPRDVVVGVRGSAEFGAHAWLDGAAGGAGYTELLRRPASALVVRGRARQGISPESVTTLRGAFAVALRSRLSRWRAWRRSRCVRWAG
jgi:hypothetical protein